jgi:hypothetical protein
MNALCTASCNKSFTSDIARSVLEEKNLLHQRMYYCPRLFPKINKRAVPHPFYKILKDFSIITKHTRSWTCAWPLHSIHDLRNYLHESKHTVTVQSRLRSSLQ